ncbi:MAG: hypothetical protein MJ224_07850 [archaeon]|nr:hypothetical protein [archaeon]
MNFGKCVFYGVVIGILIIILIKLCKSIKENFEASEVEVVEAFEEKKEEVEEKGIVDSIVDKVMDAVDSVKETVSETIETKEEPIALTQNSLDNVIEGPADVDAIDTEGISEDLTGLPKFVNKETSNVMDGPKMIPQPTINAWQDVYMNEDNDNSFMIDLGGDDKKINKDQGSGRFSDRSPACCAPQYPVPFKIPVERNLVENAHEYVPNPYMGNNNWMNAGCSCMKRVNASKLATRGGNA